jgi:hypothetical protein
MKPPFSFRAWLCGLVGHRLTRSIGLDGYGRPLRVCWCGRTLR